MPGMEVSRKFLRSAEAIGADLFGACFNVASGDVEDAPALDPLAKFDLIEKDGAVYIKGEEATVKANRRQPNVKCSISSQGKVVVIGGYRPSAPLYSFKAN